MVTVGGAGSAGASTGPSGRTPRRRSLGRLRPSSWSPSQRHLAVVLAVAALLRLAWVAYAARRPVDGDPLAYLHHGRAIADGHGYASIASGFSEASKAIADPSYVARPPEPTAFYPIGYPATVAAIAWSTGHTPLPDDLPNAVAAVQAVLGVATVAVVHAIARRLFDDRVALGAAAVVACFPELVAYTAIAFTETLFAFLVAAVVLALVWHPWDHGRLGLPHLALVGGLLGASAQVRPFTLLFVPVLGVLWLIGGAGWRRTAVQVTTMVVVVVALLTPWTVRNHQRMQAFVPISTNLGDTICISRTPGAVGGTSDGLFDASGCRYADVDARGEEHFEVRNNRINLANALEFVREHPREEVALQAERLYYTFAGSHQVLADVERGRPFLPDPLRRALAAVSDAYFFVVLGLALIGCRSLAIRGELRRWFLLLATASLVVTVPLLLYGLERFHVPVLPLLAIPAAATLCAATDAVRRSPQPSEGRSRARANSRSSSLGFRSRASAAAWIAASPASASDGSAAATSSSR